MPSIGSLFGIRFRHFGGEVKSTKRQNPFKGNFVSDEPQQSEDTRSATAKAMDLVSQISTISLTAVLPAVGGYFIDNYLGTKVVFILIGLALGMTAAGFQMKRLLVKLEQATNKRKRNKT